MGKHINQPPRGPDDGKTGYRKPPKHHNFPPGKSGNPKGRPPGSRGLKTDLKAVLAVTHSVSRNGERIKGTAQRLVLDSLVLRGVLGELKASAILLPLILQVLGVEDRDSDSNRLSPNDQALLERLVARRLADDLPAKPKRSTAGPRKESKKGTKEAAPQKPGKRPAAPRRASPKRGSDD